MSSRGKLIVLIGPSGSGKSTVLERVLEITENTFLSISATTRLPREGEQHGKHYYFLSEEEFEQMIRAGEFLEYANYVGHYYGTPREAVEQRLDEGKNVILEIEVQGALQIREKFPEAVLLFILPPSVAELKRRLVFRNTEEDNVVQARLVKASEEMRFAYECDYVVVNDVIDTAAEKIRSIIQSLPCRKTEMKETIDYILQNR